MKIKLILLLIFLISCSSETSTENFNQVNNDEDEYLEEEYEEDSDEEEYEEDSDEEYGEWDKGTTYYDTSSSTVLDGTWVKEQIVKSTSMKECKQLMEAI